MLIPAKHRGSEGAGTVLASLRDQAHLAERRQREEHRLAALQRERAGWRRDQAENEGVLAALRRRRDRLAAGELDPPRVHLRRLAAPASPERVRVTRLGEFWAAASIGLFVVVVLLIVAFARQWWLLGFAGLLSAFGLIEAILRRQATRLVTSFTVVLAVIAGVYLLYRLFWEIAFVAILLAAVFLLWENVRELRR
jgi:hypothetical protein